MAIDYERMQRTYPKHKAALTRAKKITDPIKRKDTVVAACIKAVNEWNEIGTWPDGWATWQCALSDAFYVAQRAGYNGPVIFELGQL